MVALEGCSQKGSGSLGVHLRGGSLGLTEGGVPGRVVVRRLTEGGGLRTLGWFASEVLAHDRGVVPGSHLRGCLITLGWFTGVHDRRR
mgnify:CR=1 FL=1